MEYGWIKLGREILNKGFWSRATAVEKVVYISLNLLAIHSGGTMVSPGELVIEMDFLLSRCGKGIDEVSLKEALLFLKNEGVIFYEENGDEYFITLVFWKEEQFGEGCNKGWIKLHRGILSSYVWCDAVPRQKVVLIIILLKANFVSRSWVWNGESYVVRCGEFITSVKSIVKAGGFDISTQSVRLALKKFKLSGFIQCVTSAVSHLIYVCNWDKYQGAGGEVKEKKKEGGVKKSPKVTVDEVSVELPFEDSMEESIKEHKGEEFTVDKYHREGESKGEYELREFMRKADPDGTRVWSEEDIMLLNTLNWGDSYTQNEEQRKDNEETKGEQTLNNEGTTTNNDNNSNNIYKGKKEKNINVNFDNKDIYDLYSSMGFRFINSAIIKKLDRAIEVYSKGFVEEAIIIAGTNKKFSFGYVEGILKNWWHMGKILEGDEVFGYGENGDGFEGFFDKGWSERGVAN